MSRRKQGCPQQLRRTITEDEEGDTMLEGDEAPSHFDLIKCGDCQADFALSDIVKFIEHKRKCFRTSNGSITSEDPPTLQLIAKDGIKEETDIVTPIAATPTANGQTEIKKEDREENAEEMETAMSPMATGNIVRTEKPKIITPIKQPRRLSSTSSQRDTSSPRVKQTQTDSTSTQSEPLESDNLICLTCKEPFESAGALLQHVQEDHGMHIYHQPIPKPPTTPVSESSRHSVEPVPPSECGSPLSTSSNKPPSLPSVSSYHPHHMPPPPLPPVHSPHHFPPHLDGFGMFLPRVLGMDRSLPCPPDRMFPGPLNPMLVRDMIHNEHHFHMHPPMPQHPPPRLPPPPPPPPSSSPSSIPTSSESNMSSIDIYSRKLQELATGGPAPLPPPPPPNRPMSPKKRPPYHYPMFSQHRNFKSPFPPKGKACEFCGKQFKFQSNLIVHRRSHTGEKPYKCHLCDHACSQASKLKRHMKTHKKISPSTVAPPLASTGSVSPASDTQDDGSASNILKSVAQYITDTKSSGGNTSDEEEGDCELEDLEKEEAEERETMEREEMEKERQREREREREKERNRENDERRDQDQDQDMENSEIDMPMGEEASDFSMSDSRKHKEDEDGPASLLSEVMKNTGLNEIAQYSEAFRQAVAENRERNSFSSRRSPSTEDGGSDKDASRDGEERRSPASVSQHSPSIGHRSPSIEHRSPSLGQRSPTGSHLDRHPSTSPPSLHSSLESHYARLQEVEQSLHPSHHMESTSAMRELEIVAKRIKVEPTSPSSWVQTATADSAALPRPRADPYMFSHTNENSPIATNGNLASYYRHENGPTPLPGLPRYSASLSNYPKSNHHKSHHLLGPRRNDQCEYCGKIFKNCSNLTVHRRSHTGEKPYKCNLCTYACAQSSKLTRHMKTHGQGAKEVFKCEVCGMPFSVYSTLEKHMKKSHWGAIKGTAPKPEPINANAYTSPHKTTSPNQFSPCSPLLSPNP